MRVPILMKTNRRLTEFCTYFTHSLDSIIITIIAIIRPSMRSVAAEAAMAPLAHHRQRWLVEMLAAQARLVSSTQRLCGFFFRVFICRLRRLLSPFQVI